MGFHEFFLENRKIPKDRKIFIPYFTLGDPGYEESLRIIKSAVQSGADALELGFPFSDPIADGPVIQRSTVRALHSGMDTKKCFKLIEKIREITDIPIGLLLYYNLVYKYGVERFCRDAGKSGVSGVLAADLYPEEATEYLKSLQRNKLESVFMVAQNTREPEMRSIISSTTGYLYLVAVLGVTGARDKVSEECISTISRLRERTELPICVGFGISSPEHARQFLRTGADGIIVGSAITRIIEDGLPDIEAICEKVSSFVKGFIR